MEDEEAKEGRGGDAAVRIILTACCQHWPRATHLFCADELLLRSGTSSGSGGGSSGGGSSSSSSVPVLAPSTATRVTKMKQLLQSLSNPAQLVGQLMMTAAQPQQRFRGGGAPR